MKANYLSEAYIKGVTLCVTERVRRGISKINMAERLFTTSTKLSNFEKLKSLDIRLLDEYMLEFGIKTETYFEMPPR